jgi:5-methyltetrahydropteroyltriglutamate--homocysteine methyltransferase
MRTIATTHVGSLPRSPTLLGMMLDRARGKPFDAAAIAEQLRADVMAIVRRQAELGIDIVSDGELSKPSYATYVTERLTGFGGHHRGYSPQDLRDYPGFATALVEQRRIQPPAGGLCCQGPIAVKDTAALQADLRNFRDAIAAARPTGAFMNAASPGVIAVWQHNEHYATEDDYLTAIAEAMRAEYEAIVDAGFALQLDCPDLAMARHMNYSRLDDAEFVRLVERNIAVLNHAVRNIPAERLRMHVCWGNYEGPHHRDIPLAAILPAVLAAKPAYLLIEAANPRHGHEWALFESVTLPAGKIVVPGVVDSTTNFIEHPELVAQRIARYVQLVGADRVVAATDCGFSTFNDYTTVHPDIVWRKLESLVAGARLASARL